MLRAFNKSIETQNLTSIKIVNVVSTSRIKSKLDIETISTKLTNSIYEPSIYPALIHRCISPKATIIMFASGKITSTGNSSEKLSYNSINSVVFDIEKIIKKKLVLEPIKIVNIVSVGNMGRKINLKKLKTRSSQVEYDPRKFVGAFFPYNAKIKTLIFESGKIVSVGAKNENDAKSSIMKTYNMISDYHCDVDF